MTYLAPLSSRGMFVATGAFHVCVNLRNLRGGRKTLKTDSKPPIRLVFTDKFFWSSEKEKNSSLFFVLFCFLLSPNWLKRVRNI